MLAVIAHAARLIDRDSLGEAIALLSRAASRFPDDAAIATRRAYAFHLSGRSATAIASLYRRALDLDETRFDAWLALGGAQFADGRYAEARRSSQRALALRPDHAKARFELAKAQFHMGDVDARRSTISPLLPGTWVYAAKR